MVGLTPHERLIDMYVALLCGLLALALVLTVVIRARGRMPTVLPLVGLACIAGGVVAMAGIRLLGVHAGVDSATLALATQLGSVCLAYACLGAALVKWRRRATR